MKKRLLSILLILALTLTAMPVMVFAADDPATYNAIGSGTAADPYIIQNIDQLNDLADAVNGEGAHSGNAISQWTQYELHFKLGADIGTQAEPFTKVIGKNPSSQFYGSFDGDGHTVWLGISVENESYAGLFGLCFNSDGYIRNITVKGSVSLSPDPEQYAQVCVGGIAGNASHKISGCRSECDVTCHSGIAGYGTCNAGGICGSANGMILNCGSSGNISVDNGRLQTERQKQHSHLMTIASVLRRQRSFTDFL